MPEPRLRGIRKGLSCSAPLTDTTSVLTHTTRVKKCAFRPGQVSHLVHHILRNKQRQSTNSDRILYKGSLDLAVYSRAELKSSDHKPVFAIFRTVVWIVDRVKQDALARLLLENVTSTSNGEKLDEKLAALTLRPSVNDCAYSNSVLVYRDLMGHPVPPPSSEDSAWWDRPGTCSNNLAALSLIDILLNSQILAHQVTQTASLSSQKRRRHVVGRQTRSIRQQILLCHPLPRCPMRSCTPQPCRIL